MSVCYPYLWLKTGLYGTPGGAADSEKRVGGLVETNGIVKIVRNNVGSRRIKLPVGTKYYKCPSR